MYKLNTNIMIQNKTQKYKKKKIRKFLISSNFLNKMSRNFSKSAYNQTEK